MHSMENIQNEKFLEHLHQAGVIGREDFAALQNYPTPEDIFDALEVTNVSDVKLTEVYAKFRGVPFVQINSIDTNALDIIDRDLAKRSGFIPYFLDETHRILQVAITNPRKFLALNKSQLQELGKRLGYRIEIMMAAKTQVEQALGKKTFQNAPKLDQIEIPRDVFEKIPNDLKLKYQVVPFAQTEEGKLKLACSNPESEQIQDIVDYLSQNGIDVELFYGAPQEITNILDKYKGASQPQNAGENSEIQSSPVSSINTSGPLNLSSELGKSQITLEDIKTYSAGDLPEKLVSAIIVFSINKKASDIHIEPFEKTIRVRIRVDGMMEEIISLSHNQLAGIVSRIKVLSKLKIEEDRVPQDGHLDATLGEEAIDIRVAILPTIFGEKITLRLLPKTHNRLDLQALGLDGLGYDRLTKAMSEPYGVIIATGPTGSGKTTTLYSLLNRLNKPEVDIITLEDTIEYELPLINQVKLQGHLGFGYAEGLKSALKQDPNIIYVGEILDRETADLVIHGALTGRMILTTLHTNDACEALPRLINLGVEPFLLSSALKAVTAQRLVRKLCQKCKEKIQLSPAVQAQIKGELENLNINMPFIFYRGKGCGECRDGFSGRIGIFEVLTMDNKIDDLIINKKSEQEILQVAKGQGFVTMRQDGFIKALKGLTTIDEVVRATASLDG